jgi:hypothetical protein
LLAVSVALFGLLIAPAALSESLRKIENRRVRLSDVAARVNDELRDLDLGEAPPPGGSRLFARDEVLRTLRTQGLDARGVELLPVVRVMSVARRFEASELEALLGPKLKEALPTGAVLKEIKIVRGLLASPRVEAGAVRLPKLTRRAGLVTTTATCELLHEGAVVARVPVTLTLDVDEQAMRPLIEKGARVDLVIVRGAARISASGIALGPAEAGEVALFRVNPTHKVLRARVESASRAVVVTP